MNGSRPVSRLRWVTDSIFGIKIDTGRERAECVLDETGRSLRWRVWTRGATGRWCPDEWRYPSAQMRAWRPQWIPSPGGAA